MSTSAATAGDPHINVLTLRWMRAATSLGAGGGSAVRAKDALGRYGEDVAAAHLVAAGLTILDRNWRCDLGEIDIVARDADTLVVCEVKTRSSARFGDPLEGVTPRKAARLRRLAARWLVERSMSPPNVRIDIVGVLRPARGAARVEHIRGVV